MVNFRYHIVSLVAVFLALAIGVVMGTTVIDSVLVDRLERQQETLSNGIDELQQERDAIQDRLSRLEAADEQLSEEGSERLLEGTLAGVPVLVVGVRGAESDGLDELVALLGTARATYEGTLWLDERLAVEDENTATELARALGLSGSPDGDVLRGLALGRLANELEAASDATVPGEATFDGVASLRAAGFVDFDPPDGAADDLATLAAPGTRIVVASGRDAAVPDDVLAGPFVAELVDGDSPAPTVAVEGDPPEDGDDRQAPFVEPLRADETLSSRVSTVDNLDRFAGRLAAVLALEDLADLRVGHYGQGPGATRLLPLPAPAG